MPGASISVRKNPLVIIVPGLQGDSTSLYITSLVQEAHIYNFDAVIVNYRCQSNTKITSPHYYNGACHKDVKEAIDYIMDVRVDSKMLFGVGISLGASVLANYVAMEKENCPLKAAVSVACLFDLGQTFEHMRNHFFGFYDFILGIAVRFNGRSAIQ